MTPIEEITVMPQSRDGRFQVRPAPEVAHELTGADAAASEAQPGTQRAGADLMELESSGPEFEEQYWLEADPSRVGDIVPDRIQRETEPSATTGVSTRGYQKPRPPMTGLAPKIVRDVMTRPVETIDVDEVRSPLELLAKFRALWHLPVVDRRRRLVGMLTPADVLERAFVTESERLLVRKLMSTPVESIRDVAPLQEAARRMARSQVTALAVLDATGELAGIVTISDLLNAFGGATAVVPAQVEDVAVDALMTPEPAVVDPETTLGDAAAVMLEKAVRHLPVVDGDGCLVGILSERDVRARTGVPPRDWSRAPPSTLEEVVANAMVPDPIAVHAGTSLSAAIDTFIEEAVGALPVLDAEEHVVGILSSVDVLRWLREHASPR